MTLADDLTTNASALDAAAADLVSEHEDSRIDYSIQQDAQIGQLRYLANQVRPTKPGVAASMDICADAMQSVFLTMRDRQIAAVAAWNTDAPPLRTARDALIAQVPGTGWGGAFGG